MPDTSRNKQAFVHECIAKAKVLKKFGFIAVIVFGIAAFRLYPHWQALKTLFFLSAVMTIVSVGFHLIMKRAINVLENNPSDEEILKWGDFLELYYVPKYFIGKEKNPFIIEDGED